MIDYREIENLIKALDESSLTSLEISHEGVNINMKKECTEKVVYVNSSQQEITGKVEAPSVIMQNSNASNEEKISENTKAIKSPIVGTFYSKPSPDKDPYVSKGDNIKEGQIVCIVEAMKLMNEVKSEFSGEVVNILVNDGDVIEYGQELFLIKEN